MEPFGLPLPVLMAMLAQQGLNVPVAGEDRSAAAIGPDLPPKASQKFQKNAMEFFSWWAGEAYQYSLEGRDQRNLIRDLYESRRPLDKWTHSGRWTRNDEEAALAQQKRQYRRSNFVVNPTPIIQSLSNRAHRMIFASDNPFPVKVVDPVDSVEDAAFPTSDKLSQLLWQRLQQGRIETRVFETWQDGLCFGSMLGKWHWFTRSIPRRLRTSSGRVATFEELAYECPIMETLDQDYFLADWEAKNNDVQRWQCVGNRIKMPVFRVHQRFKEGVFDLNFDEVRRRWPDAFGSGSLEDGEQKGWRDLASYRTNNQMPGVMAWEGHGLIPDERGEFVEGTLTVLSDINAETPRDGVIVRLKVGTALDCGMRPYSVGHYTPMPRAFGQSIIEPNLDIIYYLSNLVNLFIDCTRYSVNPVIVGDPAFINALKAMKDQNGNVLFPGLLIPSSDPTSVKTLKLEFNHANELLRLIEYLEHQLERRTGVSETTLGISQREKTATEAMTLSDAISTPLAIRTQLWARDFMEPGLNIALSMLQQFTQDSLTIMLRGADGMEQPVTIEADELRTGKYHVTAVLDRQDEMRLAKAQTLERILPTLAKVQPLLANEGFQISFQGVLKKYLELIGVDGIDRIITVMPPPPPMPLGPDGMPLPPGEGPPPGIGPGGAPPPMLPPGGGGPLAENGGPMGPTPTDMNAMTQMLQLRAAGAKGGNFMGRPAA